MRVQHNIMAMNAYRNYTNNVKAIGKNLEKLSSGYRINRAGDDAAGLAISEKMRAQITGLATAQKNAKDGISLIQTAEGALTEVHSMLNRMFELAEQSANGTYDNEVDRANLQKEFDALRSEIDRIADSSNFNGTKLLDGSLAGAGGANKAGAVGVSISSGLQGIIKIGQSVPVKAVAAQYASGEEGTDAMDAWVAKVVAETGTPADELTASDILSALGLDSKDYKVLGSDGIADYVVGDLDGSGSFVIEAKTAGVDANRDKILTNSNGALYEATAGAESYRDTILTVDLDGISDSNMLNGQTITINGKTYEFVGDLAKDENDAFITEATAEAAGGVKLSNGNYAISLADLAKAVNTTDALAAADIATRIANTVAAVEAGVGGSIISPETAIDQNGTTGKEMPTTGAQTGVSANKVRFFSETMGASASGKSGGGLTLQIGDTAEAFNQITVSVSDMHCKALGIGGISISQQGDAQSAMDAIKNAINMVSSTRGDLGALQNRLDHTINNLSVMQENIQDAESTIRDTDVAAEMMAYTKNNILIQSAQAMLAQANQIPQGVLQLMG